MTPWSHSPPYKAEQEPEDPAKTKEIEEQKEKQRQKEQQREPKKKQKEQKKQHRHRGGRLAHAPYVPWQARDSRLATRSSACRPSNQLS